MITIVVYGRERQQFNGTLELPTWDGANGFRAGQVAWDATGTIGGQAGIIVWNGSAWILLFSSGGTVDFGGGVVDIAGNGVPEGVVVGSVSSTYRQRDGIPGQCFWVKQSGSGNTGWAPIG